ncbi:MAG TPA: purine-nucleoside phosphorylase [Microthrixaceae bacterium]|nr:purine-nucleoside phosphorylase [Microthrixaceae bacterium]
MTTTRTGPDDAFARAGRTAGQIRDRLGGHTVAIVLGSGWASAVDGLGPAAGSIPVDDLDGVPPPTAAGHGHTVTSLDVDGVATLVFTGRAHLYEGHGPTAVVHAVRAAVLSGCRVVCLTNASGSLRSDVGVGTPVVISDHLNLTGTSPLLGAEPPGAVGNRFVDLTGLYSPRLRAAAGSDRVEGVYAGVIGPHYETPAEVRMLATMGADLVGMSTVLEAIAARHLGAEVFGVSLVTNLAAGLGPGFDHGSVLAAGSAAVGELSGMLRRVVGAA